DQKLFALFEGIRDTSLEMRAALLANDWDKVGEVLAAAHPQRKQLSENITTPHMDRLIDLAAAHGAIAPKVCGAGGGGCIAFYCEPNRRTEVEAALAAQKGTQVLEWHVQPTGLSLAVS